MAYSFRSGLKLLTVRVPIIEYHFETLSKLGRKFELIFKLNSKVNQLRLAIALTGAESSCLMACLSMLSVTVRSFSQVKISKQDIHGMTTVHLGGSMHGKI